MKIGIMGAMNEEVQNILAKMQLTDCPEIANRKYHCGKLDDVDVVVVFSRWGKVAASITATTLINQFNVDMIIFTGVAGAVDPQLNVGDIVVGNALYQHDMDARPIFNRFVIPLTNTSVFNPKNELVAKAQASSEKFVSEYSKKISSAAISQFSLFKPTVHIGTIASGDQFISNTQTHESLKFDGQQVLAVEMEGASVAQVCDEHGVPYIVIRTISDKADHSAHVDFQEFVKEVASIYSAEITSDLVRAIKA